MSLSGRKKVRRFLRERRNQRLRKSRRPLKVLPPGIRKADPETAPIDFEKYKDRYQSEVQDSIAFIGQDLDFFTRKKAQHMVDLAKRHLGDPSRLKILDVGCGIGITDRFLTGKFGKVFGVDIAKGLTQKAAKLNPSAVFKPYDGRKLPFPDHSMDVTFAICVLHHVSPQNLNGFVTEMSRVTRKGGLVILVEHNPLNPLTLHAVNHCDLDNDAILLRMGKVCRLISRRKLQIVEKRFIFFTPFDGPLFTFLDKVLGWLPLGAQYFVAGKA